MPWPLPRCEVTESEDVGRGPGKSSLFLPHLAIISVVCEPDFWTDEQDLRVYREYSTIESQVPMDDWHADVLKYVRARSPRTNLQQAMLSAYEIKKVTLRKMTVSIDAEV
jgi:hypothetical protein